MSPRTKRTSCLPSRVHTEGCAEPVAASSRSPLGDHESAASCVPAVRAEVAERGVPAVHPAEVVQAHAVVDAARHDQRAPAPSTARARDRPCGARRSSTSCDTGQPERLRRQRRGRRATVAVAVVAVVVVIVVTALIVVVPDTAGGRAWLLVLPAHGHRRPRARPRPRRPRRRRPPSRRRRRRRRPARRPASCRAGPAEQPPAVIAAISASRAARAAPPRSASAHASLPPPMLMAILGLAAGTGLRASLACARRLSARARARSQRAGKRVARDHIVVARGGGAAAAAAAACPCAKSSSSASAAGAAGVAGSAGPTASASWSRRA